MSVIDELLQSNREYARQFDQPGLATQPSRKVAVVACMDSRIDVFGILGLGLGQAHVIRNAGGVVSDDVIRSLMISQRLLATEAIILIHHTDCGSLSFRDDTLKAEIEADTGLRPPFALESFTDLEADIRQSMRRIQASPFIRHKGHVRGFIYDVNTGRLDEVG